MKTIAVVSRKGGAGKSTVSLQIAIGLWLRGHRVLIADTDPQRSCLDVLKNRRSPGPQCVASSGSKLFTLQLAGRREGLDVLIVDTPAANEEEAAQAVAIADLAVMVLRPSYMDLAAAVSTSLLIRQLQKPGLMVLNQAASQRKGAEPTIVARTLEALKLLRLPVASSILRLRTIHQQAMEQGRSAEELDASSMGAREAAALCEVIAESLRSQDRPQPAVARL